MRDTAGSPERARWLHLAPSGSQSSQSQRAIWFILPARGASHIIMWVIMTIKKTNPIFIRMSIICMCSEHIFLSSKRLPREVQKHFQKSPLKTTDRNSDTTKYEQNHIPTWNLNLPWRKLRLSQKIWKLWPLHKDQTVCFFTEKVARYEIKHEKTPNSCLYVYAYIKNPVFLRSVIICWTSLVFIGLKSGHQFPLTCTVLSPTPRVTKPYYEDSVWIEGCESVWIWNSIANFQNYVSCLPISENLQLNYLSAVHLLSFLSFSTQLAILVPTSETHKFRHSHLFILLGSTLSYGNGAFHRRDKQRLHDAPASLQVRKENKAKVYIFEKQNIKLNWLRLFKVGKVCIYEPRGSGIGP